jgi:hypothetical protein
MKRERERESEIERGERNTVGGIRRERKRDNVRHGGYGYTEGLSQDEKEEQEEGRTTGLSNWSRNKVYKTTPHPDTLHRSRARHSITLR